MSMKSKLLIESRVEEVVRARRWFAGHTRAQGLSEQEIRRLGLALSEACINVIEHSYRGQPGNPIELHLTINEESLVLRIRDFGEKFDLETYEPPDLSVPHEGGYGVFLIRSVMDEVDYDTSGEHGTTLTLIKHLPASAS